MGPIHIESTGVVYRNPIPHVRSVHAYFPSVVTLPDGGMVATIVLGEAFEAPNCHACVTRSEDGGQTWSDPRPLLPASPPGRLTSDTARLTALPDGRLVAFVMRHDRTEHPNQGLTNPETLGFVPVEMLLTRSDDGGANWSEPEELAAPIEGPCFEMCSPITVLRDGAWLLPTSTWPDWSGYCPNGLRMVALMSRDEGRSWPECRDVMTADSGRVFFWESKIQEFADGRLLAVAWVYDDEASRDRPNHFSLSGDGGATWSPPASTGLQGQTMTPLVLDDGRVLTVYRRIDTPGLWASLSRIVGDQWHNEAQEPLWGAEAAGLTDSSEDMAHNFNVLRFGAPCLSRIDDKTVFVAFWCYEDCVSVIRWFRLTV